MFGLRTMQYFVRPLLCNLIGDSEDALSNNFFDCLSSAHSTRKTRVCEHFRRDFAIQVLSGQ